MKKNVIYIPNNKDDEYKINFNEHKKEKNFNMLINHLDVQKQAK